MSKLTVTRFIHGRNDYRDCRFENDQIILDQKGRTMIGPRFEAEDCEVQIGPAAEVIAAGIELMRCRLVSKSVRPSLMQYARMQNCRFEGVFHSWKFGGRTDQPTIVDCDFRDADLHGCEFYNCDIRRQKFRGWPTFVFVNHHKHKERIRNAKWPTSAKAQVWVQTLFVFPCDGLAYNAQLAARDMGTTPSVLKAILESLGDAVLM